LAADVDVHQCASGPGDCFVLPKAVELHRPRWSDSSYSSMT
jgi:hypothetical protein